MNRRELLSGGAAATGLLAFGRLAGGAVGASASQAAAAAPAGLLQLNWNENALGLAPAARQAVIEATARANRYPDQARSELTEQLAAHLGVGGDSIVLGTGSTELLQAIVQATAAPNATLVMADPTYEALLHYQRPHSYRVDRVPLDARFAHDLPRMREIADRAAGPVVVYLCNPNNPTATLTPGGEMEGWIREAPESTLFAVDEAYFEYVTDPAYRSAIPWTREHRNVVVTRTFSKIYAMAGMRLGYAIAHPDTARRLTQFMARFNANVLALAAASASLEDHDLIPRSRKVNLESRRIAQACLDELGLDYLPSHTNFLMHRLPGDLTTYIGRMRDAGIRVGRPFPPMLDYNRLSMGLPEQMETWAETMRSFRAKGWI